MAQGPGVRTLCPMNSLVQNACVTFGRMALALAPIYGRGASIPKLSFNLTSGAIQLIPSDSIEESI